MYILNKIAYAKMIIGVAHKCFDLGSQRGVQDFSFVGVFFEERVAELL